MAKAPFPPLQGDFESLARQYWNSWNELLGRNAGQDGWAMLLGGLPPGMARMDPGGFDWFSRMQQLAGRFGDGGGASAADIARAWREMLGGDGAPFAGAASAMPGVPGAGAWLDQVRPLLETLLRPLHQQQAEWLQRPAFGPAREHQERLQALALAWQEWERRNLEFNQLLAGTGQAAFERFERLLAEHDAPGKRLHSARALFDLWIDAAEEAWAGIAMSDEYRRAYAEMTNALMRLRLGLQREVEQLGGLLGMPGRAEVDALHRKVADLERALHAARREARAAAGAARPPATSPATSPAGARTRSGEAPAPGNPEAGASKAAAKRTGAKKAGTKGAAPGKASANTPGAKQAAVARAASPRATTTGASARKAATAKAAPNSAAVTGAPAKAATRKTGPGKAATKQTATKQASPKQAARKQASPKQAATKNARRRTAQVRANDAAPASAATGQVVSMKDWVSRNIAQAPQPGGKRGGRRT